MTESYMKQLDHIADISLENLTKKHEVREAGLKIGRGVIRLSANAIRAVHRQEFKQARQLLDEAELLLNKSKEILASFPDIYHAGYLSDARKEYSEGHLTLALISGMDLPMPDDLGVDIAPFLNGMGEAVGEVRRYILDSLRRNDFEKCEHLLDLMDAIYTLLVTMDYPEAITGGLRRTTDMTRGILERTRGDLTMALQQRNLEATLATIEKKA